MTLWWTWGYLVLNILWIYRDFTKIDKIWSRFTKEINMRNTFPINLFIFLHFHVWRKRDWLHLISEPCASQATRSRMEQSQTTTLPGWLILFTNSWIILVRNCSIGGCSYLFLTSYYANDLHLLPYLVLRINCS